VHSTQFVDLSRLFCDDNQRRSIQKDGVPLVRDIGHMPTESTGKLASFLRGQLRPSERVAGAPPAVATPAPQAH
jgi:hypothetical protein